MDTSKKFTLMLDKAVEQYPQGFRDFDRTKNVQGQLQEMLNKKPIDLIYDILGFMEPDRGYGSMPFPKELVQIEKKEKYIKQFTSMEQFWLALIMEEKYNKVWNGKNWTRGAKGE